jgi:2-polyprenyl-3-methyl-5-hydroxy-6-metoxy-1,4-benzoquinol methylase
MTWRGKRGKLTKKEKNHNQSMKNLQYACRKSHLHADIRKVFIEKKIDEETIEFTKKEASQPIVNFFFFILMSVCGVKHYNTMGMLGYSTYLFDENFAKKLLQKKKKSLLDIGSGSGTITEKFETHVQQISCLEPSLSFQKILEKKGYVLIDTNETKKYEVITLFNVLDVCDEPESLIEFAIQHMTDDGLMIISIPFPIYARSWDNNWIQKTNHLTQAGDMTFEKSVSDFYLTILKKHHLKITYFTRLPYIVSLPETRKTTLYDNGLFVCEKQKNT